MSHTRSRQSHTETQYPNQNWSEFRVGENMEVQYPDGHVEKATVDEKSRDSKILWLLSHAGQVRKMYGDWEGLCLSSAPRETITVTSDNRYAAGVPTPVVGGSRLPQRVPDSPVVAWQTDAPPGTASWDLLRGNLPVFCGLFLFVLLPSPILKPASALPEDQMRCFRYAVGTGILPLASLFRDWTTELFERRLRLERALHAFSATILVFAGSTVYAAVALPESSALQSQYLRTSTTKL